MSQLNNKHLKHHTLLHTAYQIIWRLLEDLERTATTEKDYYQNPNVLQADQFLKYIDEQWEDEEELKQMKKDLYLNNN